MNLRTLDHVALWVAGRDRIADLAAEHLGMHVIERTERFTLIGADARRGKLTLFEAEGPRSRACSDGSAFRGSRLWRGAEPVVDLGEGLEVLLVEGETDIDFDLDHVGLSPGSRGRGGGVGGLRPRASRGDEARGRRGVRGASRATLGRRNGRS